VRVGGGRADVPLARVPPRCTPRRDAGWRRTRRLAAEAARDSRQGDGPKRSRRKLVRQGQDAPDERAAQAGGSAARAICARAARACRRANT
jgi:hypothetical protein